jgi:tetratricopeptide (TPR) repeat protein
MKRSERHRLKENELAVFADRASGLVASRGREIMVALLAGVLLIVAVGGFFWWRGRAENHASALLAEAMTVLEAPVTPPPPPPTPGQKAPTPTTPGSYASERAKLEAALPKLAAVYTQYPSTRSATAARYHAANAAASLGRGAEGERLYQEVMEEEGIYASMARLGLANHLAAAGQHDRAITIYKELSSDPSANVPVDGILMQLGRTYEQAGRKSEAQQTFSRIVQEFPDSLYAAEARRQLETLKKS